MSDVFLMQERSDAQHCFMKGVAQADPYRLVQSHIKILTNGISIGNCLGQWENIHLLSIGKAACQMMIGAIDCLSGHVNLGQRLVITNDENTVFLDQVTLLNSGHPIPDSRSLLAGQAIESFLNEPGPHDLVLLLLSGGGSALACLPSPDLSIEDKIHLTQLLLESGADIQTINCIRKHCSQLKGGGMARMLHSGQLHALILSDVLDNDASIIASGPSVPDPSTYQMGMDYMKKHGIWLRTSKAVRKHFVAGVQKQLDETPKPDESFFGRTSFEIIGSNIMSIDSVYNALTMTGYHPIRYHYPLCGEAKSVAQSLAEKAKLLGCDDSAKSYAIVTGGETTVTLGHNFGLGGRNQEMALAFALSAEKIGLTAKWCFLSGGTDGRDGPTTAAGGLVDSDSLSRMRKNNIDPQQMLDTHNSYVALQSSDDLLITGATGTNVADIQVLIILPKT